MTGKSTQAELEFKNEPLTRAEVTVNMATVYVGEEQYPIATLGDYGGDDVDAFLVIGLVTDEEMRSAVLRHADWIGDLGRAHVTQGWTTFTRHRVGCVGLYVPAQPDQGPCDCLDDESPVWWHDEVLSHVAEANAKRPGAIAVTEPRWT